MWFPWEPQKSSCKMYTKGNDPIIHCKKSTSEDINAGHEGQQTTKRMTINNRKTEALLSSNYFKYKWVKLSNQKTKSGRMDKSNDVTICYL